MFPNMVAFGPTFEEDEETIHQPDEYAEIDKLMLCVELSAAAMVEMAVK